MNFVTDCFWRITDAAESSTAETFQDSFRPELPFTCDNNPHHTPLPCWHPNATPLPLATIPRRIASPSKVLSRRYGVCGVTSWPKSEFLQFNPISEAITDMHISTKRPYDLMERDPRQIPCNSHHRERSIPNTHPQSTTSTLFDLNIPPPTRRGFDLRRPIMSQMTQDVIDLTEETSSPAPETHTIPPLSFNTRRANRPPRSDRDIISVDDQEDNATHIREESPEIQFLRSEPLRTGPRSRSLSTARPVPGRQGHTPGTRSLIRRPHVAVRMSAAPNHNHPQGWARAINLPLSGQFNVGFHRGNEELIHWEDFDGGMFQAPGDLDFFAPAFNYDNPSRPQQQPRLPTYDPPSPAKPGFTRSPNDDDTLVCPHCDDELGVGDSDVKRQVWVVKACGHVCCFALSSLMVANIVFRSTVAIVQQIDTRVGAQAESNHSRSVWWRIAERTSQARGT